jgi:hypothetical protein
MKYRFLASTLLGAVVVAGSAWAIDQTIDVSAKLRVGLSFTNKVDMDFTPTTQFIDMFGTVAGTDTVALGTDGTEVPSGAVLVPTVLTGTPGSVEINGAATNAVDISCSQAATLAETTSSTTITVDTMELSVDTGDAAGSADYTCAGVGTTPHPLTLDNDGKNLLLLGGRLVGAATMATASYSSANTGAGGVPATVRVVYQ